MKYEIKKRPGYILFLTMSILAIVTLLVTQLFYVGTAYNIFVPLTYERESAKQLALSGISIATAQLLLQDEVLNPKKSKKNAKDQKQPAGAENESKKSVSEEANHQKQRLKTLLLIQNQWQEFSLVTAKDGIDGTIKLCITCEDGKVNLNQLYNFNKKSFYSVASSMTTEAWCKLLFLRMKSWFKDQDIETLMMNIIKKQKQSYTSPFDLLGYSSLNFLSDSSIYTPDALMEKDDKNEQKIRSVFLNDIFTTETKSFYIDPWILSSSLRALFGFVIDKKIKQEDLSLMLEKIDLNQINWETTWDSTLKEFYGKEFKSLDKEFVSFLSTKFEPHTFSVVCYGKVGRVTQKLLAILKLSTKGNEEVVTVKKIYWL